MAAKNKIPKSDYAKIISQRNAGEKLKDIAKQYGVSASAVHYLIKRIEKMPDHRNFIDNEIDAQSETVTESEQFGEPDEAPQLVQAAALVAYYYSSFHQNPSHETYVPLWTALNRLRRIMYGIEHKIGEYFLPE